MYNFRTIILFVSSLIGIESIELTDVELITKIVCQVSITFFTIFFLIKNNLKKQKK